MSQFLWNNICRLITMGCKIHVTGKELIPEGPKIFVCNHPTSMDPCYVYEFTEDAAILMTQFVFDLPLIGRLVNGAGFIPVAIRDKERSVGRKRAFCLALNELLKGRNLLIAPEGKMSQDNLERKAHNGASRLACATGFPIVPMNIRHVGKVKKFYIKDQKVLWMPRGDTYVSIKAPYYVGDNEFQAHTEELMKMIS